MTSPTVFTTEAYGPPYDEGVGADFENFMINEDDDHVELTEDLANAASSEFAELIKKLKAEAEKAKANAPRPE